MKKASGWKEEAGEANLAPSITSPAIPGVAASSRYMARLAWRVGPWLGQQE